MDKQEAEPSFPDVPGWEDDLARGELEYQRDLTRQGELESQRLLENRVQGDVFNYDDGRPGLGVGLDPRNGLFLTMPLLWRFALIALVFVLIAAAALITRACVGEDVAQHIFRGNQPAADSQASCD